MSTRKKAILIHDEFNPQGIEKKPWIEGIDVCIGIRVDKALTSGHWLQVAWVALPGQDEPLRYSAIAMVVVLKKFWKGLQVADNHGK